MSLLAATTSWAMFLVGLALLIAILFRRSYRYYGRQGPPDKKPSSRRRTGHGQDLSFGDAPPEILRWQVAMHETARDLKAELDSKMGALQALIRLAREESERLEAVLARSGRPGGETWRAQQAETAPAGQAEQGDQQRAIYTLADQGETADSIARRLGAALGDVELMLSLRSPHE